MVGGKKKNLYIVQGRKRFEGEGDCENSNPRLKFRGKTCPPPHLRFSLKLHSFLKTKKEGSKVGKRQKGVENLLPDRDILQSPPTLHDNKCLYPEFFSYMMAKISFRAQR